MSDKAPTSNIQHPTPNADLIVRLKGGYALKFHTNHCGRMYEIVADAEATTFTDQLSADERAHQHGLRDGTYEIEPLTAAPVLNK